MKPTSLFKRVFDFARAELERRARSNELGPRETKPGSAPLAREGGVSSHEVSNYHSEVKGLEVVRTEHAGIRLSWSVSEAEVARARAFTDADAVLCVRVVAFSPLRDDVLRQVQDRPGVELRGDCDVGIIDGRAIVSIGLRAGERFVSITHHTL
jgi:hypothetical protein